MTIKPSIKPPALKKGDLIGIMAPSRVITKGDLDAGIKLLEGRGYHVEVHPQTYDRHPDYPSSAGTEDQKSDALHDLFKRKDIKAIFAATGGSHALWTTDHIDYAVIRRNPKIFMGFSDTTALLNAFNARSGLTTFHGPLVRYIQNIKNIDVTFDVLSGKKASYDTAPMNALRSGSASGRLIGGNVDLVYALVGTQYFPKADGAILFMEDTSEEAHKLDRIFWKLRESGVLDKISGLVMGGIKVVDSGNPYGLALEDIIARNTKGLKIPIVINAPFGHDTLLATMPIGGPAKLSVRQDKISFALSEPAVTL